MYPGRHRGCVRRYIFLAQHEKLVTRTFLSKTMQYAMMWIVVMKTHSRASHRWREAREA